jgi:universal stress protein E
MSADKILVVINPTRDEHLAFNRAFIGEKDRENKRNIHLFVAVDPATSDTSASNEGMYVDAKELRNQFLRPLDAAGIEFTAELCWSTEWYKSVLESARRHGVSIIVLPDYSSHEHRRRLTDSKWALLRHAECPVVLVRPGAPEKREVILAAVNMQGGEKRDALNDRILAAGHSLAEYYGADLHIVSAYPDSMHFPDRATTLNKTGVENDKLHVAQGNPADVISEVADKINADEVIIGTMKRTGLITTLRGDKSEEVLRKLDQDVVTIN